MQRSFPARWRRGRWRRRRDRAGGGENDEGGASRCSSAPSRSARVFGGFGGALVNLVPCAAGPPPFFIAQRNGGPPTIKGWTPPIRARINGLKGRWAYLVGDQPNILPLDLTLYFKFIL